MNVLQRIVWCLILAADGLVRLATRLVSHLRKSKPKPEE